MLTIFHNGTELQVSLPLWEKEKVGMCFRGCPGRGHAERHRHNGTELRVLLPLWEKEKGGVLSLTIRKRTLKKLFGKKRSEKDGKVVRSM